MQEFAGEILRATGQRGRVVYRPLPTDDPKQRRPDITRARRRLGWEPEVSLAEGLKQTIRYFRNRVPSSKKKSVRRVRT